MSAFLRAWPAQLDEHWASIGFVGRAEVQRGSLLLTRLS